MPKTHKTRKNKTRKNHTRGGVMKYLKNLPPNDDVMNDRDDYLNVVIIPKGSWILTCSPGYRTIKEGELPPMKYLWAQLFTPEHAKPKPTDSWFCQSETPEQLEDTTFYIYKTIRELKLFIQRGFTFFGNNVMNINENTENILRFQPYGEYNNTKPANDYVNVAYEFELFNIDGIFRGLTEIILFSPYGDKLEFVERIGGEKAKQVWTNENESAKVYFKPSKEQLNKVRRTLKKSKFHENKLRNYYKNLYKNV